MPHRIGWSLALAAGLLATPARAAIVFYADRASFDAANPGLPVEDFEEARVDPLQFIAFDPVLSAATANAVFSPGDILPGLGISSFPAGGGRLLALGAGTLTGASKLVGDNFIDPSNDRLDLLFAPGITALGADLYAAVRSGDAQAATVIVTILDTSGLPTGVLGAIALDLAAVRGGFLGFTSDVPVGRVTINTPASAPMDEFIDNLAFGTPGVVPEPGSLALLGGGLGLLGLLRRRSAAVPGG